jgi:hypothetical protein
VFWDTPEGRPFEETMARGFGGAPSITPPLITCVTPPWYLYRIRSGFAVGVVSVARGDVEDVVDRDVAEDAEVKEKPESEISESESDSESQSESASESEAEASSSASKE